jgi:hypothetical protein
MPAFLLLSVTVGAVRSYVLPALVLTGILADV